MDVGLVGPAAEAALEGRGVGVLQGSLRAVALQAQGLQFLDLAPKRLVHRDHVVELTGSQPHGRPAELAQPALHCQDLLPVLRQLPLRFQELS